MACRFRWATSISQASASLRLSLDAIDHARKAGGTWRPLPSWYNGPDGRGCRFETTAPPLVFSPLTSWGRGTFSCRGRCRGLGRKGLASIYAPCMTALMQAERGRCNPKSNLWLQGRCEKRRSEDDRKPSDTPEGVKSRNRATRTQRPTLFYLRARNYRAERYGTRYGAAARIQFHDLHTSANTYYIGRVFRVMGVAWQLKNGVSGILQQQVRAGAAGPATRCGTSSATARRGPTS